MSPSLRRAGQIVFGRMPNGRNRRDSSPCVSLRGGRSSFGPCHSFHRPSSSPISVLDQSQAVVLIESLENISTGSLHVDDDCTMHQWQW
jgi:hypothetical protein